MRQQSSDGLYNVITMVFVGLTLFVCIIVGLMLNKTIKPPQFLANVTQAVPTAREIPSETPTVTPSLTPLPSNTLIPSSTPRPTVTLTYTPTDTLTPLPTETPLPTPTDMPPPPPTDVPIVTDVPQPTAAPAAATAVPTPVGFAFKVQESSPALLPNIDSQIGCAYQGIGGQVFGMNSEPMLNLTIQVTSATTSYPAAVTGSNPRFGESGWMVQMDVKPSAGTYFVQVLTSGGVPLSDKVQINFPGTCDQNQALINFVQTKPF